MQAQDSKQIVVTYLLSSPKHADNVAIADTIRILKEQRRAHRIFYIVTYTTSHQQQLYASIVVHQTESGFWDFEGFQMMGGTWVSKFPQKPPPQVAFTVSSNQDYSFVGVAVLSNEVQVASISLIDAQGLVFEDQLENSAVLFVTDQWIQMPLEIALYDHAHLLVGQHRC